MTHTGIECFLAICRHKTGSAAAQSLYITQPSLSARLKALEQELGVQLFYRRKGSREMILTQAGQEFYRLAQQYEALISKMKKLGETSKSILRVSCFNSLGTYLMPPVCDLFMQANPQIRLQMQDMDLSPARQSILRGFTDIAFTTGHTSDLQLQQFPAFSEPMVLVGSSGYERKVDPSQLPLDKEVYVDWSKNFTVWHRKVFDNRQPRMYVSVMAHLRQCLEREGCWAIVPFSVAKGLMQECKIQLLETDIPLPRREMSYLISSQRTVPAIEGFLDCLRQVLSTYPEIEIML